MRNKKLFSIGIATAAAVALAASLVSAQAGGGGGQGRGGRLGPQGPGGRFGGGGFAGGLAGLNLTEEQRTKVSTLQRAAREQAAPLEEELRAAERALHKELFADARDAGRIGGLSTKIVSLQKQLSDLQIRTTSSVADVLTAEQRATIREREGRGGGRGPGRSGGRFRHL